MDGQIEIQSPREGFQKNIVPYLDEIFSAANRLTVGPLEAGALAEQTFINAWQHFYLFQKGSNIRVWLYQRLAQELRKNNQMTPQVFFKNDFITNTPQNNYFIFNKVLENFNGFPIKPIKSIMNKFSENDILSALRTLPHGFRETLVLADFQKLSYEEITQTLMIPLETVQSRLNMGRHYFQKALWNKTQEILSADFQRRTSFKIPNRTTFVHH